MRFARNEWVAGDRAVFEKFADYVPRQEPGSWLAGGKRISVDRIEWKVMPDPATAAAALQNGEIDWWENPISDLVPLLRKNRNILVDIADPLGNIGSFRMNHLYPPFNDVRARRAVLMAMSQEDYMHALVGDDDKLWKPLPGFFTPGTPLYTEEGGDILKGPRNLDGAKKLLAQSGYAGQPVTCLVAQDQPITKAQGDVTADLLKRLGMNVDFAAIDWGTVGARRSVKTPPGQGGWQMFHTWHSGADCINPAVAIGIRGQRRQGLVRLAGRARGRDTGHRVVRCQDPGRGEGRDPAAQQGGARGRGLCADRLLPDLSGLAQERFGRGQRAPAVLLGRCEDGIEDPQDGLSASRDPSFANDGGARVPTSTADLGGRHGSQNIPEGDRRRRRGERLCRTRRSRNARPRGRCGSCLRPTSPISIRSGTPSTWCATARR